MKYNNYHKHDHISNIYSPDTHIKTIHYLKRIQELGYGNYFTTNHGSGGDVFESLTLCEQYNIHCKYGIEGYIVKNPLEKDNRNYHIVIIPKDNIARKKLNLITSRANTEGYYYKPRIFLEDLFKLNPNEIYITTACVSGLLKDKDSITDIFVPLVQHFGKNVFLEIQNHNDTNQIRINNICKHLSKQYDLELIAGNDSHYIYPEQAKDRLNFLKGKGINYGDEDSFILDFPDYDTMFSRFQKQGILSNEEITKAINNTLVFDDCEDIKIDKSIKMPSIYPNLSADEKIGELKKHVLNKFKNIVKQENIQGKELEDYKRGIYSEMQVIEDTKEINTADYFLLNEKLVDLAVNKYGGVLTRTGRGSCGAYYINRILGMTQLDRFKLDIKLYPERFISTARLLENRAMPDIDFNIVDQEPFIKASKELLGENGCYPMIAYGTMQLSEAFRNVCRTHGLSMDEYNEVAKNIENHLEDTKWKPFIDEANKYIDTIVSASVHPCAFLLSNKDIREEYGVVKIGDNICVMITSNEADEYKMLKDDFLIVTVYKLIDETFKLIGKPIMPLKELCESLDDKVWELFENKLTCTLNQVDGDWATELLEQFRPKNISDMAMFVACLRPFFNSWRDSFIARKPNTSKSKHLNELLKSTYGFILFQENLMQYFEWLGVTPSESIGLIKKISKKKIRQKDFEALEGRLRENWLKNTGSMDYFNDTWDMVQSCMSYGFASPHACGVAIDCLYGAYLKAHYPLEYYTVALETYSNDIDKTTKLMNELPYFNIKVENIKFGKSSSRYNIDKKNRVIYKNLSSIKYCNSKIAEELMELSKRKKYNSFIDLLYDIKKTSVDSRQLKILIILNFFSEFGNNKYLLDIVDIFEELYQAKILKKAKIEQLGIDECLVKKYSNKETATQYRELDNIGLINTICNNTLKNKSLSIKEQVKSELEYLGYTTYINKNINEHYYVVTNYTTYKDVTRPYFTLRNIKTGDEIKTRITQSKIFKDSPFGAYNILKIEGFTEKFKKKNIGGEWRESEELEKVLEFYEVIN